jgi:cytochrome c553
MSASSEHKSTQANERIALTWGGLIAATVVIAALIGFVWLPQPRTDAGLWAAICSALGIPSERAAAPPVVQSPVPSALAWTPQTLAVVAAGDAARGKAMAAACAGCHGADGIGTAPNFPNLAGQTRDAIYKQLHDYKSGHRVNPLMTPFAQPLTEPQMADLAAYYAQGAAALTARLARTGPEAPRLVAVGDPLRNIAPCGACHGAFGLKEGAPLLVGQKPEYLEAQLRDYASGARRNDINAQMRALAKALRDDEITALVAWYAGQQLKAAP